MAAFLVSILLVENDVRIVSFEVLVPHAHANALLASLIGPGDRELAGRASHVVAVLWF